jgi:cyclopropane-fatty-acyl-phospholipid synthase
MRPTNITSTPLALDTKTGWFNRRLLSLLHSKFDKRIKGRLLIELPNKQLLEFGEHESNGYQGHIRLKNFRALKRLVRGGTIGFAEGYMDGDWSSSDEVALMRWALHNEALIKDLLNGHPVLRIINRLFHLGKANSKRGSRKNISYHYDLGNDFYSTWLDRSFTYSSALFNSPEDSLEQAQLNKYRRICEMLDLQPGQTILEVGCGWGGFAELAAGEFGAHVYGITLSKEQLSFAENRIKSAGLDNLVKLELIDYRDVTGSYDHIVSIEMFEAVGEENWPTYFEMLKTRLKPSGKAVLQIISIENKRFIEYRKRTDFIQRYIFPGGMLPSPNQLNEEIKQAHLTLNEDLLFGQDYAKTLSIWREQFETAWPSVKKQGFDERFKRMWIFYLTYCEAGFAEQSIDVGLYSISH